MQLTTDHIIATSQVAFGTSGARGLVSDFGPYVCAAFTQNFVRSMQSHFAFSAVAIGIDNRPSSPDMAAACIGLLQTMGIEAKYYGVLPTPALAHQAMQSNIPAIMITGSHIPFDRNGIKFYRPDGEISKADETSILTYADSLMSFTPALPEAESSASKAYLERYLSVFSSQLLVGKHIGIYEHSSAGRDLYHQLFSSLGAQVTRLARSDVFVPIDTEAVTPVDMAKGRTWADEYGFDCIFSTDGDGDRPLIADEKGNWLRGDIVGLLCANALGIDALAVPVSCNTAIEKSGLFQQVRRTKIGSPYVIEAFDQLTKYQRIAGFEANGGFLLGSNIPFMNGVLRSLPTRDAVLPVLALLASAGSQPLSSLVAKLPPRYTVSDRLQNVPKEFSKVFMLSVANEPENLLALLGLHEQVTSKDLTDGVRLTLFNKDVIHIRPSGNAPELRCYVESSDENMAKKLLSSCLQQICKLT